MMRCAEVYALMDPRFMAIRYIGGTVKGLERRLKTHIWYSMGESSKNYPSQIWIRSLIMQGIEPIIVLLFTCETEDYDYDERVFILACRTLGCDLLNVMDGGQRGFNGKHSLLSREKMSKAQTGKKKTEEQIENLRISSTGRKHTDEAKEKLRQFNLGKKLSLKSIEKRTATRLLLGSGCKPRSKETCKNISKSQVGRIVSKETREIMSKSHLGKKNTPEQIERWRQANSGVNHWTYKRKQLLLNDTIVSDNWDEEDNWPNQYLETI